MDFSLLLEEHPVPTTKKSIQELQRSGLDTDHTGLDMSLRDREEIQSMQDGDPDDLYDLAWETASEEESDCSSSYLEDYDSDECVTDEDVMWDSDLEPISDRKRVRVQYRGGWEEYVPMHKPSILEKAAGFLKRGIFFALGIQPRPTMIRWLKFPGDEQTPQVTLPALEPSNYHKTIRIYLTNGLNRYNVNFDIDHKETSTDIVISVKISDKSRSTICIYASDDTNKSFQKIVRSRKSEMKNKPPKDLVVYLVNGLRLSSLNIHTNKSEILIKIHDESWREMFVMIDDHYPILRNTLWNVKLEEPREKLPGKVMIHAELSHGLTLSNTEVNCCYKRCPEVEFKLQCNGEATLVNLWDGTTSLRKLINCDGSEIATERIGDEIPLECRRINIRLSHIKRRDIDFAYSRRIPEESQENLSIVLKILSKTNAECIIFDQDQEKIFFDIEPTDLQVEASKYIHYPPWEFQEVDTIHIGLPKGLYLNKNVTTDFLYNKETGYMEQVQLKIKELTPIRLVTSAVEQTVENFMEKIKKPKKDEINIDLKDLDSEKVSLSMSKPTQDKEGPFGQVLTIDTSKLSNERLKLHIEDDEKAMIKLNSNQEVVEGQKKQGLIVFRMDDMFNSDVFKILGVHGVKNKCSTNITSFYGRIALKEEKLVTIRVFDQMHVLENIITLKTKHIKRDYYLRKTKDIKVDDHHCNLSIFLKNITCEEITLRCEHPDGITDQNISFSLIVTTRHPLKVLLSNDLQTVEHCSERNPKPVRKEINYVMSDVSKVVRMQIPSGISLNDVNFIWEELNCLMSDDLKQKITIVLLNEGKAKTSLQVVASNRKMRLFCDEEDFPVKTIDLHLPFDAYELRGSIQADYSIFELDVYNNSPILLEMNKVTERRVSKIDVGVNVAQESSRTRAKFKAELQQLEDAFTFETTTRYTRQINHCILRSLDIQLKNSPIEEKLERQSKEAMDKIWRLRPFTFYGKFYGTLTPTNQACLKTKKPVIAHKIDEDFYDDLRSRLKNLKDEDARCTVITGKQPSRHLDQIDKLLEAINQLKPTPDRFKFEIDQKSFSSEDEALLKEALDQIEAKILEVKKEIKPEALQEKDLTEDDLNSLEDKYRPLKGKLLHGSSIPMKGDNLNQEDNRSKPSKPKKIVEEPIGTDCVNPIEEFVVVEMPEGISIEIEEDVDAAFKYYSELIPNLKAFGQNVLDDQNIQDDEGNIGHSQDMPLVESEGAIPKEVCKVPVPESYSSEVPSTSAPQEVPITQSTNATKVQYCQCDYCPQRTTGKNHLQNHSKNHNQLKKDPDYFCLFCGRGFKTNGWLKKHIEDRHKDKVLVYSLLNLEIIKLQN